MGPSHADPSILLYVLVYVPHNSSQNSLLWQLVKGLRDRHARSALCITCYGHSRAVRAKRLVQVCDLYFPRRGDAPTFPRSRPGWASYQRGAPGGKPATPTPAGDSNSHRALCVPLASTVSPVPACNSWAKGGGTVSTSKPEAFPSPRFWRALGAYSPAPRRRPHPRYWRRRATL